MTSLTIRVLYAALLSAWFAASTAVAETEGLEMLDIEAGATLQQAVEAIPIDSAISITAEQKADLHSWLYDFLVAFSGDGSDSLAATFYLREGVNNPDAIQRMKKDLESGPSLKEKIAIKALRASGVSIPPIPEPIPDAGDTPWAILKNQHRQMLDFKGRDYFFSKASLSNSAYRVFELQGAYENYMEYADTHGLLSKGASMSWSPKLEKEVAKELTAGEQHIFAQFMFTFEEPEESADFETGPMRRPFFVRLVWSPEKNIWRLVEIFTSNDAPVMFAFATL